MSACEHSVLKFEARQSPTTVSRLRIMSLEVCCMGCGRRATFHGLPLGVSEQHPTMRIDRLAMHVPFVFEGDVAGGPGNDPFDINDGFVGAVIVPIALP